MKDKGMTIIMDKKFCLLDEKWIKVFDEDLQTREVSLCELFVNAHRYQCLAGESPTQDVAIFRVLLAITITVFYRTDADGRDDNLLEHDDPEEEILDRWEKYYRRGEFYGDAFVRYLEQFRERFYLFHPQYPFWQVSDLDYGTGYDVKSFIGNMKESNNSKTMHHFSITDGEYLTNLRYAEVARWLIFLNAYAVNIKADKKAPGSNEATGTGRLGRLGFIKVKGNNLFEEMMLNLCVLRNGEAWGNPRPIWEFPDVRSEQGVRIEPPDNLPQLYTIQSRRICLRCVDNRVVGFRAIGGDFYDMLNDSTEQMTLLCERKPQKKGEMGDIAPKTHSREIQSWREFPSMFIERSDLKPGIVIWLNTLRAHRLINNKRMIIFQMTGLEYGDGMSYTYGDIIDDTLSLSAQFLSETGKPWIERVRNQVGKCTEVVDKLYFRFSRDMGKYLFKGDSDKASTVKKQLAERYYFLINNPFREWLGKIRPETDDADEKEYEWERISWSYAMQTIDEYICKQDGTKLLQMMQSYNYFMAELAKLYKRKEHS